VNLYSPEAQQRLRAAMAAFISSGSSPAEAQRKALGAIFGSVQQQAAMLSFLDAFKLLGGLFLAMLPLILLMKKPKQRAGGAAMGGH